MTVCLVLHGREQSWVINGTCTMDIIIHAFVFFAVSPYVHLSLWLLARYLRPLQVTQTGRPPGFAEPELEGRLASVASDPPFPLHTSERWQKDELRIGGIMDVPGSPPLEFRVGLDDAREVTVPAGCKKPKGKSPVWQVNYDNFPRVHLATVCVFYSLVLGEHTSVKLCVTACRNAVRRAGSPVPPSSPADKSSSLLTRYQNATPVSHQRLNNLMSGLDDICARPAGGRDEANASSQRSPPLLVSKQKYDARMCLNTKEKRMTTA